MQNQIYEELLGLPQLQVNAVSVSAERIDIYCESTFKACHCPVCLEPTTKITNSTSAPCATCLLVGVGCRCICAPISSNVSAVSACFMNSSALLTTINSGVTLGGKKHGLAEGHDWRRIKNDKIEFLS